MIGHHTCFIDGSYVVSTSAIEIVYQVVWKTFTDGCDDGSKKGRVANAGACPMGAWYGGDLGRIRRSSFLVTSEFI